MDITILRCMARGFGPRAAGLAAHIEDALEIEVEVVAGKPSQFGVMVDGKVIASRGGSMLKRVLGGGRPNPGEVIAKIEALQVARKRP